MKTSLIFFCLIILYTSSAQDTIVSHATQGVIPIYENITSMSIDPDTIPDEKLDQWGYYNTHGYSFYVGKNRKRKFNYQPYLIGVGILAAIYIGFLIGKSKKDRTRKKSQG